jgi:uncharacterized protein (TIGR02266 family)
MSGNSIEHADVVRQVRRAIGLIDLALSLLGENRDRLMIQLVEVAEQIERAKNELSGALSAEPAALRDAAILGNEIVDFALAAVRETPDLPSSQALALEVVVRTQAVLYPLAYSANPDAARPPPVLDRRSPQKKMEGGPGVERRMARRVPLRTDVTLEGESNFYTGFTGDISTGGLFIYTYNLQPIGTKIALTFTLPGRRTVNVKGEVRWARDIIDVESDTPPGLGIMFEELPEADRDAIGEFVKERDPLFYDEGI